jgi:hypothetical protein
MGQLKVPVLHGQGQPQVGIGQGLGHQQQRVARARCQRQGAVAQPFVERAVGGRQARNQ